ncbi:MAG: pyridoxal 5'-phosphate synthase glutaminase subunit PdxT [Candidatus Lutacidiplasmatales archaeon]|nr:pyridoxal 5'-phosphate synthase glutaminase subunit PdxT [Thermoplasmata archaeon]
MKVGVLALQGDVPEHLAALAAVIPGDDILPVRTPAELERVGALFLPGGESTTIARLLVQAGLWNPLADRLRTGFPVLATCAGLILLARELSPSASGIDPPTFGVIDAQVRRNDYGTQRESFEAPVRVEGLRGESFPGVFIRSPRILSVGPGAMPIAWRGEEVVGVRAGDAWGLTFHPELSGDSRVHRLFLEAAHVAAKATTGKRAQPRRRPR